MARGGRSVRGARSTASSTFSWELRLAETADFLVRQALFIPHRVAQQYQPSYILPASIGEITTYLQYIVQSHQPDDEQDEQ